MRKIKIIEHILMDCVIQVSGGPGEDGDFPYGDWTAPYRSPAGLATVLAAHGESFDLLLGRRTYDMWSGFWPKAPKSPMANSLNAATTKYVATTGWRAWNGARSRVLDRTSWMAFAASRRRTART